MTAPGHLVTLEELAWGLVLIGVTMILHAFAMPLTLAVADARQRRNAARRGFFGGVRVLLLASGLIVVAHLVEVVAWAAFFRWQDAFATSSDSFYYALLQYTTVGSDLSLPGRWDLLGGMIAIAGALSFAWSTAVLLVLADRFQGEQLRRLRGRRAGDQD